MSADDEIVALAVDLLGESLDATSRRMFGGAGLFFDDAMFAIVANGSLYFKVDAENLDSYVSLDLPAFQYTRGARTISMSFREPPPDALERPQSFRQWALPAISAAERAAASRAVKRRRKSA